MGYNWPSWEVGFAKTLCPLGRLMLCYCSGTLADYFLLENLCKALVASLCNHTWLGSKFFGTFTRLVVKVYNLCRVKTDISVVLTVKAAWTLT